LLERLSLESGVKRKQIKKEVLKASRQRLKKIEKIEHIVSKPRSEDVIKWISDVLTHFKNEKKR